jgi:rod shape determining protein RodA
VTAPAALVLKQPDLGTAMMLLMAAGAVFFVAGARLWMFALAAVLAGAAVPIGWQFLRDYQRQRVLTFLDPESDPLGAGYHILQSKIALGSGGLSGKGFLAGTQSHLSFLPEKQTDFIFTMLAEEFGMIGGLVLLGLFFLLFVYGFAIALRPLPLISYGGTAMLAVMLAFGLVMSVWIHRDIRIPRRGLGDT